MPYIHTYTNTNTHTHNGIFSSIHFSHSLVSDSSWRHGLQHTRHPCPSPTPRVYSNSCPSSQWWHPTISSSVVPFSSCLQSFPASGSFLFYFIFFNFIFFIRWECKLVQPLWKTVWRFLKKLEIELPYDPAIPLLGIHIKETRSERDTYIPMFIAALFIIARTWKQPRCPSADEWIRKLWYIYTMEYYSASGSFQMSQLFTSGGQSIGISASASVLPMNIHWFPLEWTGWISLQSKGLSRVFSNTTVQKHQFFSAQPFL